MDMKEIIADAARKLILEKKVKKLTVKDIVEECQITRQAFYYHFEGIPDLIQWSMKQGSFAPPSTSSVILPLSGFS